MLGCNVIFLSVRQRISFLAPVIEREKENGRGRRDSKHVQKPCAHIHAKTMCAPMCKAAAMSMEYMLAACYSVFSKNELNVKDYS